MLRQTASSARLRFRPRNLAFLTAAILALVVGYFLLRQGDTTLAPVLLVLGYCVLFPLGLAL